MTYRAPRTLAVNVIPQSNNLIVATSGSINLVSIIPSKPSTRPPKLAVVAMALDAMLSTHLPLPVDDSSIWQFPASTPDDKALQLQDHAFFKDLPLTDEHDFFSQPSDSGDVSDPSSSTFPHGSMPQTVQLHELHADSPSTESSQSPASRHGSIGSTTSSYLSPSRRETLRRLSLATLDVSSSDSYRPRSSPARPRRATTTRIQPRDDKHARELELNRKAATKCRNRQKAFVENLQERCRREERRMHLQTSLVHALHDEVVALRNEVLKQSFCDCRYVQQAISPPPS